MTFVRQTEVLELVKMHPGLSTKELARLLVEDYDGMAYTERKNLRRKLYCRLSDLWKQEMVEPVFGNGALVKWEPCDGAPSAPYHQAKRPRGGKELTVQYRGMTKCLGEWCRVLGLRYPMVRYRLTHGWSAEDAFTVPPGQKREGC